MTDIRIFPVATIASFGDAQDEFRQDSADERRIADYAESALSAWLQGLIPCAAYAEACEEIAEQLRRNTAASRAS